MSAGLAVDLRWPVGRVRFLLVLLSFAGGFGVLFYLWLWALTPLDSGDRVEPGAVRRSVPVANLLTAGAAVALLFVVGSAGGTTLPIAVLLVSALGSIGWTLWFDRDDSGRTDRSGAVIRWISEGLLVVGGLAMLVTSAGSIGSFVLAVAALAGGIVAFGAPLVVAIWTQRMGERDARERQSQRAEIAAHLQDSVLQTLALIQKQAGASSDVARLARAQERELRDWLFAGTTPAGSDIASELRDAAAAIELDYPARVEIVVVGESIEPANAALLAATREAIVNAARHAGGEISVYLEISASATDIFVRDRGAGFDVAALPDDRIGVRESIIGRMNRAGGTARVVRGVGGSGTEVHLRLESEPARG